MFCFRSLITRLSKVGSSLCWLLPMLLDLLVSGWNGYTRMWQRSCKLMISRHCLRLMHALRVWNHWPLLQLLYVIIAALASFPFFFLWEACEAFQLDNKYGTVLSHWQTLSLTHYLFIHFLDRMALKNAGNYVVAMVIYLTVGFLNYLPFMYQHVHMKETTLFYFYRYLN